MKKELRQHLSPLFVVFVLVSFFWVFAKVKLINYFYLLTGLVFGSFFLDFDHLIYWLYLKPNIEESRLAQIAIHHYDFKSIIKLLESTHKEHTSLIFHHFFFQVVLALISFFVFTSSDNVFGMAFLFALNVHLIVDEVEDFRHNKKHLQDWLFAREQKQLPIEYLSYYLGTFILFSLVFVWLLIKSRT